MRRPFRCALVFACVLLTAVPAAAQTNRDSNTIDQTRLFNRTDLYVAGGFAAGTVLLFPLDQHLAREMRADRLLQNGTLGTLANKGRWIGGSGVYLIGGSLYALGRLGRQPTMAEIALHGTEAVLVGKLTADVIKGLAGRARPYASADTNARDFSLGRGVSRRDYQSFPSGHTTHAFAAAAAVVAETHARWPGTTKFLAPLLYGGATGVGLSRMYQDQHWASDVMLGAAIGTFAGLKTVRFNHTRAGNRLDRMLLGLRPVPTGNGVGLGYAGSF